MPAGSRPAMGLEAKAASAPTQGSSRPVRLNNSHVASLQQKFEKKEQEAQETKLPGKAAASARRSMEVKPAVAPKPK